MKFEHVQTDYQSYNIPMPACNKDDKAKESANCNKQIESTLFYDNKMRGVFFSYTYNGTMRVYVTLEDDTDLYNSEISLLLQSSIDKSNCVVGLLWVRKKTPIIIAFLEDRFHITLSDELFVYESTTFIIYRNKFQKKYDNDILEIKQYEDSYLDDCLRLFNEVMLFKMPPHFYTDEREHYLQQFRFNKENVVFETFWINNELIGLYWLNGEEVDVIAVSSNHQRKGYGSLILTRAIERAFHTTNKNYVWLIASNFNEKARSFYSKYGMEVQTLNRIPRIDSPIELDRQMRLNV